MAKEEVVWLELPQESCDVSVRILPYSFSTTEEAEEEEEEAEAEAEESGEKEAVVVVHAPSQLLNKIPYFATSLSQPWLPTNGSSRREITLVCSSSASCPADFRHCLQFLNPQQNDFKWQLNAVLKLLRPADYLHFQECTDLCMQYLATVQWSGADETTVHQAFADTGIKPSADVCARLAPLQNPIQLFKEALLIHAEYACTEICGTPMYDSFPRTDFARFLKDAVIKASPKVAQMSQLALTEVWISLTDDIIKGQALTASTMNMWSIITSAVLEQGDKSAVLKAFIERFQQFSNAVLRGNSPAYPLHMGKKQLVIENFEEGMARLMYGVIPGEKPIVMSSNAERAALSIALSPMLDKLQSHCLELAFKKIICTLPLEDPSLRKLMKEHPSKFYHPKSERQRFWERTLFLAMDRSNIETADTLPTT